MSYINQEETIGIVVSGGDQFFEKETLEHVYWGEIELFLLSEHEVGVDLRIEEGVKDAIVIIHFVENHRYVIEKLKERLGRIQPYWIVVQKPGLPFEPEVHSQIYQYRVGDRIIDELMLAVRAAVMSGRYLSIAAMPPSGFKEVEKEENVEVVEQYAIWLAHKAVSYLIAGRIGEDNRSCFTVLNVRKEDLIPKPLTERIKMHACQCVDSFKVKVESEQVASIEGLIDGVKNASKRVKRLVEDEWRKQRKGFDELSSEKAEALSRHITICRETEGLSITTKRLEEYADELRAEINNIVDERNKYQDEMWQCQASFQNILKSLPGRTDEKGEEYEIHEEIWKALWRTIEGIVINQTQMQSKNELIRILKRIAEGCLRAHREIAKCRTLLEGIRSSLEGRAEVDRVEGVPLKNEVVLYESIRKRVEISMGHTVIGWSTIGNTVDFDIELASKFVEASKPEVKKILNNIHNALRSS